jgi:steroid delta-isomerase-like uncharacterized protein
MTDETTTIHITTSGDRRFGRRAVLGGGTAVAAAGLATRLVAPTMTIAQEATPTAIPSLLEAWAAAWSSGDVDQLVALYTPDAVYEEVIEGGVVAHGPDEIRAFLAGGPFGAHPDDLRIELLSGFEAGGWAAAEWRQTATHTGDLPGFPATGRKVDFRGTTIFELAGDKIRRDSEYFDWYTVQLQLGIIPAAEESPPAATPEA